MPRPHDAEVPLVKRERGLDAEPLGHGDHAGISRAEWQDGVLLDQCRRPLEVGGRWFNQSEGTGYD